MLLFEVYLLYKYEISCLQTYFQVTDTLLLVLVTADGIQSVTV